MPSPKVYALECFGDVERTTATTNKIATCFMNKTKMEKKDGNMERDTVSVDLTEGTHVELGKLSLSTQ